MRAAVAPPACGERQEGGSQPTHRSAAAGGQFPLRKRGRNRFRPSRFRLAAAALCLCLSVVQPTAGRAEEWPAKPLKLIVPFPAGGGTDVVARIVANGLGEALGQPVVVDNRGGAGGTLGADLVAKAPPDGYTILMATVSTHGINPNLYKKVGYDPVKDFAPISLMALVPNVLEVNPAVKASTVQELIALAKASPGKINFASSGSGTSIHMSGELFKLMAAVDIVHVPYKGSAPALTDLLGGQVDMMFDNLPASISHIRAGKLRPLAVTTTKRAAALPDVPTMEEAGLKGYEATAWFGLLAPAGTPMPIVEKMSAELDKYVKSEQAKAALAEQGAEPVGGSPESFDEFIKAELVKWGKVVQASGAQVD
jgi:tripartite-type tricarboxylate transporter receptor subunit TctC